MQNRTQAPPCTIPSNLHPYSEYICGRGLTRTTGYRYRVRGMIRTSEIYGRLYISSEEIQRFEARVAAGDFRRERKVSREEVK